MGLDSNLYRKKYVGGGEVSVIEQIAQAVSLPYDSKDTPFSGTYVEVPANYWRKWWFLHNWFARHVDMEESANTDGEFSIDVLVLLHAEVISILTFPVSKRWDEVFPDDPEGQRELNAEYLNMLGELRDWLEREIKLYSDHETTEKYPWEYHYRASW